MINQSLYSALDLPNYSEISLIKKSFRQLALQYHPDRNNDPSVVEKFKSILNAYEVLNNPELKLKYDERLKNGFENFSIPLIKPESEFEEKRRRYAKMKQDQDALKEVQNITAYEKSLTQFPFVWRIGILGLLLITGMFSIVADWYIKGNKIALGFLLLIGSALFLWNEFYKFYWHKSLTSEEKRYDKQAMRLFITILFIGFFSTFGLIKIKKIWHLNQFGKVVYAGINQEQSTLAYTYNEYLHVVKIYKIPKKLYFKDQVLIRISTKEPEIWEYFEE